jgi:hypothetical protein
MIGGYAMRSKLMHIGLIIACMLIILLFLVNFAVRKDYKKVQQDIHNCPCEEGEFCRDGICTAANPDNNGTITRDGIGNEAGRVTLAALFLDRGL